MDEQINTLPNTIKQNELNDTNIIIEQPVNTQNDLRLRIMKELVDPSYYLDVKDGMTSMRRWGYVGDVCELLSHIFTGFSTAMAFAAGFFNNLHLSFVAGLCGVFALLVIRFSAYSFGEKMERSARVNNVLTNLGISQLSVSDPLSWINKPDTANPKETKSISV
jgi:hypothetical protein